MHKDILFSSTDFYNAFCYKTLILKWLFILMMSRNRTVLLKIHLKIQSNISVKRKCRGLISRAGQSWLLPALIHLLFSPLLSQVFSGTTGAANTASHCSLFPCQPLL